LATQARKKDKNACVVNHIFRSVWTKAVQFICHAEFVVVERSIRGRGVNSFFYPPGSFSHPLWPQDDNLYLPVISNS